MEKIKEIWKEIVEKYKNQKTELLLMLIFVVAGICLGISEISQEVVSVSAVGTSGPADEAVEQEARQSGENMEVQSDDADVPDSDGEDSMEQEEDGTDKKEDSSEENDTENMTEEETELDEEEALEVMRRYDRRRRAALGRDFIIPMAMPEGYVRPEYDDPEENAGIIAGNNGLEENTETAAESNDSEEYTETAAESNEPEENTEAAAESNEPEENTEAVAESNDPEEYTKTEAESSEPEEYIEIVADNNGSEEVNYVMVEASQTGKTAETDADSESLVVYTLRDTRELQGYELLVEYDADLFAEVQLEAVLRRRIASYDGDWSVYVKNLKTDQTILINDRPMKSASVMKLFILGTMYKAFENGEMERSDEIMSLMNDMIVYSSNEASNELLYRLGDSDYGRGIEKVNEFIQEYGFSGMTVEYNGFDDPATNTGTGNYNQVSAKDCGKLLEDIYHREWVNRSVSNEIEQMMLNQNTRYKIPAGLPEGVSCGNKSGEMDTTENDAAIVYTDSCDYILVVLSSDWSSKDEAISRIQSISSLVYQHLAE